MDKHIYEEENRKKVITYLKKEKIIGVYEIARLLNIHYFSAEKLLNQLVSEGLVEEIIKITKKNYIKKWYILRRDEKNENFKT